jgi:hypothetical protein
MSNSSRPLRLVLFALLGLTAAASSARAQSASQLKDPDAVLKAIRDHFKEVPAEFDRYRGGAEYGEVLSRTLPTLGAKTREVALLEQAEAAGLFAKLPDEVLRLGHNVIVHDPMSAVAYVRALHAAGAPFDDRIQNFVVAESVAAGEFGEKLAVAEMDSTDPARRAFWSEYLQHYALYASSRDSIIKAARRDLEPATRAALERAHRRLRAPDALPFVRELLAGEKDDAVQAAAIFAFTGLAGFDGSDELAKVKTAGKQSAEELSASRDWLRNSTSANLKHGAMVNNDAEFADRFADQPDSEVMRWIGKEGLLESRPLSHPKPMRADRKRELLARLEDAKGFGLEAVKGTLFVSLEPDDETTLLRIRQVSYFSPNAQSEKRASTIAILVRTIRHGR